MKRPFAFLLVILLSASAFFSCSKEHEYDFLYGRWESVEASVELVPKNEELRAAIENDLLGYAFELRFYEEEHRFEEYCYIASGQFRAMSSGNYFYNNGYKGHFPPYLSGFFQNTHFEIDRRGELLEVRCDATRRYTDPLFWPENVAAQWENVRIDRVSVSWFYVRSEGVD